jgi:hypothetical protein
MNLVNRRDAETQRNSGTRVTRPSIVAPWRDELCESLTNSSLRLCAFAVNYSGSSKSVAAGRGYPFPPSPRPSPLGRGRNRFRLGGRDGCILRESRPIDEGAERLFPLPEGP